MTPYHSTLVIVTCVTCLSLAPIGKKTNLFEPAIASSSALEQVAQATSAANNTPPTLQQGSKGKDVTELQTKLSQLGFYNGKVDGGYGESTAIAVGKFQKSVGLKVDGVAGLTTWNRIQQAYTQQVESKTKTKTKTKKLAAKSNNGTNKLWLLAGFGVATAGIGIGMFFLLRWFSKATKEMEPEPEGDYSNEPSPEQGLSEYRNGSTPLEPSNGVNKNGASTGYSYESTNKLETPDNPQESLPESPNLQNLPSAALDRELVKQTPPEEITLEKTTPLAKIDIVDELTKDLQTLDPAKRRRAIWELAQRGDSRAIQPLVELIVDSDSQQRGLILEALSQIGIRTLKPMNRALAMSLQDENAQVRKNAIRDVTRVYEMVSQINYLLRHALDDPDAEVQETGRWAIEQLNRIRSTSGLDNLPALPNFEGSPDSSPEEPRH